MMKNYLKNIILMFIITFSIFSLDSIDVFASDEAEIGINNLNNSDENSAMVGDALLHPEKGWKRYDDTYKAIQYGPNVEYQNQKDNYNSTYHGIKKTYLGEFARFSFTGDKLRLIGLKSYNYSEKIQIEIDGKIEYFDSRLQATKESEKFQTLVYSKEGLSNKKHNVIITHVTLPQSNPLTYDFRLDAIDISESGEVIDFQENILDIDPYKQDSFIGDNVSVNLYIHNIKDIAAEDVRIEYDSEKLEFLGTEEVSGIKLVKEEAYENNKIRLILSSQGINNVTELDKEKVLLKLNFKAKAKGEALIDIIKGRISDGIDMERDLLDKECGEGIVIIDDYKDPSRNGEFTLLDLAIDGRHFGEDPADLPEYNTDVVVNGAIDDEDLIQIGKYMLENPNYTF